MKLWPVVVQDADTKDVLMLAYADSEALRKTKAMKYAWFYSRSRRRLWKKGETSGNTMRIVSIKWDCDKDALLYSVKLSGPACHTGAETCFGERRFGLETLFKKLEGRRKRAPKNSYTAKLLTSQLLLEEKIMEEVRELIKAKTKKQVIWEAADLLYFTLVKLVQKNVRLAEVVRELKRRNQKPFNNLKL